MHAQLLAQAAGSGDSTLIWVAVAVVVGYLLSLRLHPYRRCRVCKGSPRRFGALFNYAFRLCGHCGGRGRQPRYGTYVFGPRVE